MSENKLTDRKFWANYWESKAAVAVPIHSDYLFHSIFKSVQKRFSTQTAIELGGFPGYHSVYLKRYLNIQPTLLDFYIHRETMAKFLQVNGLFENDVKVIEADLFTYSPKEQYDLVFSCGLIEHFEDTEDIIKRHIDFLKPGGTLLITLPNFRGINGWFQRKYDPENYQKHNINCMDTGLLHRICQTLSLTNIRTYHYGHFSIWLENYEKQERNSKILFKSTWLTGKVLTKIIPINNRTISPYIVVEAQKPASQ